MGHQPLSSQFISKPEGLHGCLLYKETITLKFTTMKLLITILMLAVVAACGLFSLHFFRAFDYDVSSLLDVVAYGSIVTGIYFMTVHNRKRLSH